MPVIFKLIGTASVIYPIGIFDEAHATGNPITKFGAEEEWISKGAAAGKQRRSGDILTYRGCELRDLRMRSRLRLFVGAEAPESAAYQEPEVSMKLGELTRILADAIIWDRTWIADFADDDVRISADLFEVLSNYSQMRPSA